MYRAMNKTGWFQSIFRTIYRSLLMLSRDFTHIGVSFWWGRLSSPFPAVTSTVVICCSRFFIRRFYNTFIKSFQNSYVFKRIYIFLSNIFTIKTLHLRLNTPAIWHTVQNNFIQFHLTNFSTCLDPGKASIHSLIFIIWAA